MKLLVTGASSLPGFRITLEALNRGCEVVGLHWSNSIPIENNRLSKIRLDIRDSMALRNLLYNEKPDVIIHMAALGDVDLCERAKRLAWETTVEPSILIASCASKLNTSLVYISTDYVFDGKVGGYMEYDPPNPVNYYGLTKLMGEIAFRSSWSRWTIVRASSIYGFGPGRMNFAKFLVDMLRKGEAIKALTDQYTSPTQASLLAEAIMEIVESEMESIFHIVGERMSRYEFALKVAEALNLDKSFKETMKKLRTEFYSTKLALSKLKEEYFA